MQRKRLILALLNPLKKERTKAIKHPKVACNCHNCNGSLVDPRTKIVYENDQFTKKPSDLSFDSFTLSSQSASVPTKQNLEESASIDDSFMDWPMQKLASDDLLEDLFDDLIEDSFDDSFEDSDTFPFQPRKRKSALNRMVSFDNPLNEVFNIDTEGDDDIAKISTESDKDFDEFQDTFEDYSAPPFKFLSDSSNESADNQFKWIILWIMNFKIKFNLPNTATDALLKFMKLVLTKIGGAEFEPFCSSLYTANMFLGISDEFIKFV